MRKLLLCTVGLSCVLPGVSHAADQDAVAGVGLKDIIVTAQRREESLQRAAVPVNVISGADLVAAGASNATLLNAQVPALTVEPSSTGNLIFMRGVGNFTVVPTSDPAIAFNYDGVYVGRPTSTTGSFFDLARVEVLKGPQGTLYGRNATGGALNVIPERPRPGENSGYGTISYGNYNALNIEGAVNLAMGEHGAARLSGTLTRRDGYLSDGTSDDRTEGLRFQMMGRLTDALTVRIGADYAHNGGYGYSVSYTGKFTLNPATGAYAFAPANIPLSEGLYSPASQAFRQGVYVGVSGRLLNALTPMPYQNNDFYGTNAEITWTTGIGTVTFIPAWRYSHLDYLSDAAAFFAKQRETDEQYSGELRLNGNRLGMFDYVLGAYYYHERENYHQVIDIMAQESWADQGITTQSWAPFARLTAHVSDRLRLVGGLRYTHDQKSFNSTSISGTIVCAATVGGVPTCPNAPLLPVLDSPAQLPFPFPAAGVLPIAGTGAIVSRSDATFNSQLTNQRVTWRAAVEYDLAPRSLAYASVETGYRSGGFSASVGHETYQPEYITAYTIGVKNRLLDNRLQLNLEGFWWDYVNQQVNHVGLDSTGRTSNFTDNIGASRIYGVEGDIKALVAPHTLLSADVQYLHAQNRSFVYTTGASSPPLVGCPYTLSGAVYVINCSNYPANNAPRWTVNLAAQQTIPLGDYNLVLGVDTQYKSSHYINFYYISQGGGLVGGAWQSNAQIAFGPANSRWTFAIYMRNMENNRIPVFMSPAPLLSTTVVGTTPPRTYGARFSVKF
ncbi:TonB-dependent receptor [Novosphingobium terrae]|uniref:TonB-dependent receptor n=1 Tax=Novosphingobium terrae TaxID=2726189 RepID=UPI00197F5121|nr:TonB-dependent receptor [Novosphingobium terrae]